MTMTQEEIRQLRVQFLFKGSHSDVKKRMMQKVEKKPTMEMEKEALKAVLFAQGCDISKIKGFWNLDANKAWEAATMAIDGEGALKKGGKLKNKPKDGPVIMVKGEPYTIIPGTIYRHWNGKSYKPVKGQPTTYPPGFKKQAGKAPETAPVASPMPEHAPKPEKPATARRTQITGKKKQVPTARPGRIKRRRQYQPKSASGEPLSFHKAAAALEDALHRGDRKTLFSHHTIYNLGVRIIQASFDMIEKDKVYEDE